MLCGDCWKIRIKQGTLKKILSHMFSLLLVILLIFKYLLDKNFLISIFSYDNKKEILCLDV